MFGGGTVSIFSVFTTSGVIVDLSKQLPAMAISSHIGKSFLVSELAGGVPTLLRPGQVTRSGSSICLSHVPNIQVVGSDRASILRRVLHGRAIVPSLGVSPPLVDLFTANLVDLFTEARILRYDLGHRVASLTA